MKNLDSVKKKATKTTRRTPTTTLALARKNEVIRLLRFIAEHTGGPMRRCTAAPPFRQIAICRLQVGGCRRYVKCNLEDHVLKVSRLRLVLGGSLASYGRAFVQTLGYFSGHARIVRFWPTTCKTKKHTIIRNT